MRLRAIIGSVLLALLGSTSIAEAAVDWSGKTPKKVQGFYDGADCIYFTLNGVTEADPIKPGDPIFVISRSQYGAKDALAILIASKISGQTIHVTTRGNLVCGYAGVAELFLE